VLIEELVVDGNQSLSRDAFFRLTSLAEGDPYDEEVIREEFHKLWERGLFEDLSVESRDGETGKIVIFHIAERPRLNSIEYEKNKVVTETQVEDALTEKGIVLRVGGPVDYRAIQETVDVIRGVLGAKGYLDPEVDYEMEPVDAGNVALAFNIKPGRKTRVEELEFLGNEVFSDSRLRAQLELTQRKRWWRMWGKKKTLYHPQKLDEDLRAIDEFYKNAGYLDIRIDAPQVEVKEGKPTDQPEKRKRWVSVQVPIREGPRYTVGEVKVEGNNVMTDEQVLRRIPLKEGQVFNNALLKQGTQMVELDYGERGYFFVSTNRLIERRDGNIADVTVKIDEDKKYFIDRIEFVGNTTTRDKVLRRELGVNEEELFNLRKFRLGLRKVNQLGYFALTKEPEIKPVPGENRVRVSIEGVEQSRNEVQVGGGFSGLDGPFFAGSYSTRNFLGRGQTLSARIQIGGVTNTFALSFQEPWFLGKPWILGATLFRRDNDYVGFQQSSEGYGLTVGKRVSTFSTVSFGYMFERITFNQLGDEQKSTTSSIRPVYVFDTRNNPFRPSRGFRMVASMEFAGGPLAGDNFFYKPIITTTYYFPVYRQTFFGVHAEIGYVDDYDGRAVPTFEKFFLGGERSLRLYPSRSVAPINDGFPPAPRGRGGRHIRQYVNPLDPPGHEIDENDPFVLVGGNKYLVFNLEYVIPAPGDTPIELALFFDAGNAWTNRQGYNLGDMRRDAGIEVRFYLPIFGAPIRLIYGWVLDPLPGQSKSDFIFSIGTTF